MSSASELKESLVREAPVLVLRALLIGLEVEIEWAGNPVTIALSPDGKIVAKAQKIRLGKDKEPQDCWVNTEFQVDQLIRVSREIPTEELQVLSANIVLNDIKGKRGR